MGLELYGQAVFVVRYEEKGERGLLGEGVGVILNWLCYSLGYRRLSSKE